MHLPFFSQSKFRSLYFFELATRCEQAKQATNADSTIVYKVNTDLGENIFWGKITEATMARNVLSKGKKKERGFLNMKM